MKTVEVTVRGERYGMPVSIDAIDSLNSRGVDVFGCLELLARKKPIPAVQTVELIAVGLLLAGCKITRDEIGQAIVEDGLVNYRLVSSAYVLALCSGKPAAPAATGSKKKPR